MAELKTKPTNKSVAAFLNTISDTKQRDDSFVILHLMKKITKEKPIMWGSAIVGFGSYHYKYASGHEGKWPMIGFSPRKQSLTLYVMSRFKGQEALLKKMGKHKTSKGCLYVKNLKDVNMSVLERLIKNSFKYMAKKYSK